MRDEAVRASADRAWGRAHSWYERQGTNGEAAGQAADGAGGPPRPPCGAKPRPHVPNLESTETAKRTSVVSTPVGRGAVPQLIAEENGEVRLRIYGELEAYFYFLFLYLSFCIAGTLFGNTTPKWERRLRPRSLALILVSYINKRVVLGSWLFCMQGYVVSVSFLVSSRYVHLCRGLAAFDGDLLIQLTILNSINTNTGS